MPGSLSLLIDQKCVKNVARTGKKDPPKKILITHEIVQGRQLSQSQGKRQKKRQAIYPH